MLVLECKTEIQVEESYMRVRVAALLFGALLFAFLVSCSKKEQPVPAGGLQQAQQSHPGAPAGQAPQTAAPAMQQPPAQPTPPPPIVIPAGSDVVVRMGTGLSSKYSHTGGTFTGTLANAIAVGNQIAIPAGVGVTGVVSEAKSAGRFKGAAILAIQLTSINVNGIPVNVSTDEYIVTQKGKGKRTAALIGGGAAGGALIGGIAGGGKGAGIGALIGAGAGTAGAAFTGNKELSIPAESAVSFTTKAPISIQPTAGPGQ
jgi:hypothetical protein